MVKKGLLTLSLGILLSLLSPKPTKGDLTRGYVHPSIDGTSAVEETTKVYLSGNPSEILSKDIESDEYWQVNLMNFNGGGGPLPPEDSLIYMYVDTTDDGYTQNMRRPAIFDTGANNSFPDCFLEAPGETSIALDVNKVYDSTSTPYVDSIFADCYPKDYPSEVQSMYVDVWKPLSRVYFNNLSFEHPPTHGDSVVVRVRKQHADSCYLDSLIAEIDTTMYGGAAVLADAITLKTPTTSSSIKEYSTPTIYLLTAYPNPFNSAVRIAVANRRGLINQTPTVEIFDVNGRCISVIARPEAAAISSNKGDCFVGQSPSRNDGQSQFTWQPTPFIGSGVYLVRARAGDESTITKRIVYLK